MGLFRRRNRAPSVRGHEAGFQTASLNDPQALARILHLGGERADAGHALHRAHDENPTAAAAVLRIQTAAKGVPWLVTERGGDGTLSPVGDDHPVGRLLAAPNPWMAWEGVVEHVLGSFLLRRHATVLLNGPGDPTTPPTPRDAPLELLPVPAKSVRVIRTSDQSDVQAYGVRLGTGAEIQWHPARVVHLHPWDPDDVFEGSPLGRPAGLSIAATNEGRRWNWRLLHNLARPPGSLETENNLTAEQRNALERHLRETYQGADNAGTPIILEGGLSWKNHGHTPVEMDWTRGLREMKREIATAFLVAPELLGDPEVKTYANAVEARAALYDDTVFPLLGQFAHALTQRLSQWWPGVELALDKDNVTAVQHRRREFQQAMAGLVRDGIITRNEAREQMGWPKVEAPEADQLLIQATLIPLQDAGTADTFDEGDPDDADGDEPDVDNRPGPAFPRANGTRR